MNVETRYSEMLNEIANVMRDVSANELRTLCNEIVAVRRIFLIGAGRTGLILRMLAMRLMQVGRQVYFVGDCTTPAIVAADLLIAASFSGTTTTTLALAKKSLTFGARLSVITGQAESPLTQIANTTLWLPIPKNATVNHYQPQVLNTLFEQCLFVTNSLIIEDVIDQLNEDEPRMLRRHANLE